MRGGDDTIAKQVKATVEWLFIQVTAQHDTGIRPSDAPPSHGACEIREPTRGGIEQKVYLHDSRMACTRVEEEMRVDDEHLPWRTRSIICDARLLEQCNKPNRGCLLQSAVRIGKCFNVRRKCLV